MPALRCPPAPGWALDQRSSGLPSELFFLRPAAPADLRDWRHPEVGWGLVLPDDDTLDVRARAVGEDAPAPLRRLLAARAGAPVLRWREDLHEGFLRRYYDDGTAADLSVAASRRGTARHCIPRYLLLGGGPDQIPWRAQYVLNMTAYVGRLALTGPALDRYVDRLTADWTGASADPRKPLIWSVDHGRPDISWLMRGVVADPLWAKFAADPDLAGGRHINGPAATVAGLSAGLAELCPGLVVTTSHGATPYGDPNLLRRELGFLVDVAHATAGPDALLADWRPDGAIWYAQACCSAGSEARSRYSGLFGAGDPVGALLDGVADAAGDRVAPLPQALLSAPEPLRAWVGHVEPTFDWTLRDPRTGQVLTAAITAALHDELYRAGPPAAPIGYAVRVAYEEAGRYMALWQQAVAALNGGDFNAEERARFSQLVAMDRQNLVILGDPTVALANF